MPATRDQRWHRILDMACMLSDRNFKRWRQAVEAYPLEVFIVTSGDYELYEINGVYPVLHLAMDSCPEVTKWDRKVYNDPGEREQVEWVPTQFQGKHDSFREPRIEVYPLSCPFPEWLENGPRMIDQRDAPTDPKASPGRSNDDPVIDGGARS